MKTISILGLLFLCIHLSATNNPSEAYIEQYKHIAVSEMQRTGIPASIKLAQGMLESASGRSTLAREANNHFGIKCNGGWEGETYYREDDDHDKAGNLIKSCFRKFNHATESFFEHSHFLTDQKRYRFLFDIQKGDYKAWAYGLKKAGYATDKAYPTKLITIIEKYQLYLYDQMEGELPVASNTTTNGQSANTSPSSPRQGQGGSTQQQKHNKDSETVIIAASNKTTREARQPLKSAENTFHIVADGETIAEIAMLYELDETKIRLRNRIPKDAEPLKGEMVFLRKKISVFNRPQFTRTPSDGAVASEDEYIF